MELTEQDLDDIQIVAFFTQTTLNLGGDVSRLDPESRSHYLRAANRVQELVKKERLS